MSKPRGFDREDRFAATSVGFRETGVRDIHLAQRLRWGGETKRTNKHTLLDLTRLDVTDRVPVGDSQASGDSSILLAVNGTRGYEGSNDTSVLKGVARGLGTGVALVEARAAIAPCLQPKWETTSNLP